MPSAISVVESLRAYFGRCRSQPNRSVGEASVGLGGTSLVNSRRTELLDQVDDVDSVNEDVLHEQVLKGLIDHFYSSSKQASWV